MSGNNIFFVAVLFGILSGCSPKTIPPPIRHPDKPGELPKQEQPKIIDLQPRINSIALILPFNLNNVNPEQATIKDISKSDLAIDFYQGLKLAFDSLKKRGYHFRLGVFDGQSNENQIANLSRNTTVTDNDLIIGPVFPDEIRTFSNLAKLKNKLQVSPLAASAPLQFNNPLLVTVNNTIDQHGWKVAYYIAKNYSAANSNIILINTRSSDSEKFAGPVKTYLSSLSANTLKITEVTNSVGIESFLSKTRNNIVIVAPEEQSFVMPTINRLFKLSAGNKFKIDVFGHPNWSKINIDVEQLQQLNTRITSSYTIDYNDERIRKFVTRYHSEFKTDPSEYSFKGFDIGYYFGGLLGEFGPDYITKMTKSYEGLHNDFKFSYDAASGFQNTEIKFLEYRAYELKIVK
ncbi:MAG TPA: hypothetical protein VNI52_02085 [Sphingobacteriaceae bacterium]|nr:hypothetical protein [Sphingobacteriaceae bacterium]